MEIWQVSVTLLSFHYPYQQSLLLLCTPSDQLYFDFFPAAAASLPIQPYTHDYANNQYLVKNSKDQLLLTIFFFFLNVAEKKFPPLERNTF